MRFQCILSHSDGQSTLDYLFGVGEENKDSSPTPPISEIRDFAKALSVFWFQMAFIMVMDGRLF